MRALIIFCVATLTLGVAVADSVGDIGPPVAVQSPVAKAAPSGGDIEALAFTVLMEAAKSAQEDVRAVMASVKAINKTKAHLREELQDRQKLTADPCKGKAVISWRDCMGRIRTSVAHMELAALDMSKAAVGAALVDSQELVKALDAAAKRQRQVGDENYLGDPCKGRVIAAWRMCFSRIEQRLAGKAPDEVSKRELETAIAQIKADLDSMSEMGEVESLRLQMAMDRMSKMMSTLSNILKKISDTANQITRNLK